MTWIDTISYGAATGHLSRLYDRIKGPADNVDNIMLAHSLRPHTLEGHMSLYKQVLHHPRNEVAVWFLEVLGVYTSLLNRCDYCIEHHYQGLRRILNDDRRSWDIRVSLVAESWSTVFEKPECAALSYARKLTVQPAEVSEGDVDLLRASGWSDGEILEINQVVAYFNYANRTVLGLGVESGGDILGLSPGNEIDADNWSHR
ncbi:MAG: peroxidase-related enzyme [Gammaproteobacteria bacterium]|nr:peroxidase-related enzyme [Gammaproteobacteria bacterium]